MPAVTGETVENEEVKEQVVHRHILLLGFFFVCLFVCSIFFDLPFSRSSALCDITVAIVCTVLCPPSWNFTPVVSWCLFPQANFCFLMFYSHLLTAVKCNGIFFISASAFIWSMAAQSSDWLSVCLSKWLTCVCVFVGRRPHSSFWRYLSLSIATINHESNRRSRLPKAIRHRKKAIRPPVSFDDNSSSKSRMPSFATIQF